MFSFTRLRGADPRLGVEMSSTGEVACFGLDVHDAFLRALLATRLQAARPHAQHPRLDLRRRADPPRVPRADAPAYHDGLPRARVAGHGRVLRGARHREDRRRRLAPAAGDAIVAKGGKAAKPAGRQAAKPPPPPPRTPASWASACVDLIRDGQLDLLINIPGEGSRASSTSVDDSVTDGYLVRRAAVDFGCGLITNIKCATMYVEALYRQHTGVLPTQPLHIDEFYAAQDQLAIPMDESGGTSSRALRVSTVSSSGGASSPCREARGPPPRASQSNTAARGARRAPVHGAAADHPSSPDKPRSRWPRHPPNQIHAPSLSLPSVPSTKCTTSQVDRTHLAHRLRHPRILLFFRGGCKKIPRMPARCGGFTKKHPCRNRPVTRDRKCPLNGRTALSRNLCAWAKRRCVGSTRMLGGGRVSGRAVACLVSSCSGSAARFLQAQLACLPLDHTFLAFERSGRRLPIVLLPVGLRGRRARAARRSLRTPLQMARATSCQHHRR